MYAKLHCHRHDRTSIKTHQCEQAELAYRHTRFRLPRARGAAYLHAVAKSYLFPGDLETANNYHHA